jgi:hypothetical protein
MYNGITVDGFLTKDQCSYIIEQAISSDLWEESEDRFWTNRLIHYPSMYDHNTTVADMMMDANIRCKVAIKEKYGIDTKSDTLQIVRWFPGMEQPLHADDMTNTEHKGFEHRLFGSIIYLNDGYQGGQTYYGNFDIKVTPKAGTLAIHPGDPEHLHGVTKIEGGTRYTIASFWGKA